MKATQSRISSQNAVHAILPHSEPRVASPTPSTTSVRSIKSIRSTANSVAPSVAGTEASQKSWLDEAADNESSIAAGSIVSSIEGGSIEGSIPNSRTSSKASKRREPTDPSDYNAVTVNLMHASRLRQWDASSDPFAVVTVGTAGTSFDDKMDVLEEIGRHDCLWESEAIHNTQEPTWDEVVTLPLPKVNGMHLAKLELHIRIMDKDMGPGEDLGEARIRLNKFITDIAETPSEATLNLEGPGAGNDEPNVSIKLNFTNIDDFKEESTVASFVSEGSELLEMKRERMHTGQWVPEIYQVGRLKPWTKLWTCCGCDDHLSMYCPTLADRVDFAHKMYERNEFLRMQPIKEAKAREVRMKWEKEKEEKKLAKVMREEEMAENGGEEPLNKMEKKHFFASKETKKKLGIWREPKLDLMSEAHGADENDLYEMRMRKVKPSDISMVVSAMRKNIDNGWMVDQAMEIIKRLLDQRDAQKKCIQFGALSQILAGLKIHVDDYKIQLKGLTALRKYCDYVPTQEKAILNMDVTNIAITRLRMFREKEEMVQECCQILKFTAQLRKNRLRIFDTGSITHITCAVVQYRGNEKILCASMFLLETISSMDKGKEEILNRGLIKIALSVMHQYGDNEAVLAASMGMLLLACEDDRGLVQMISSNGVETTLSAMKHLVHKAELQQRGLEFMRKLAGTTKGAQILDGIKGSWQWLAQGTESGNALVHLLPGPLQSKGWAMGEVNEQDVMHKGRLYLEGASGARGKSMALWTASSLSKYMGLSQKEQSMKLNAAEHEFYFTTIRDLGLLPRNDEQREYWFQRVKKFEKHHAINIQELVDRNQIYLFGGVLPEDVPVVVGEDGEEVGGEKGAVEEKKEEGGGKGAYKEVTRKTMLSRAEKAAIRAKNRPSTPEKPVEKRAVFLEGKQSSGWVSKDAPWEKQHNMLYDVDHEDELHHNDGRFVARTASHHVNLHDTSHLVHLDENHNLVDGDPSVVGGEEKGSESEEEEEEESGEEDDEDDEKESEEEEDESSMTSSAAHHHEFVPKKKATVVHAGKTHSGHSITLAKDLRHGKRKPEKRRDVFVAKDRHGDLYIPKTLEELFPEVIGTEMETAKSRTDRFQYKFYEDPYRFGKTAEELAAMDAAADLDIHT